MTKIQKKILYPLIKKVRKMHSNAWWELKYQIWSFGFQTYYPMQDEFNKITDSQLKKLNELDKAVLIEEWTKLNPDSSKCFEELHNDYSNLITQELVRRAEIAANRTENW